MTRFDIWGDGCPSHTVLARLARLGGVLAAFKSGFVVCVGGDRRRRPAARLSAAGQRALLPDGALEATSAPDQFRLSQAGAKRLVRLGGRSASRQSRPAWPIGPLMVMDDAGVLIEPQGAPTAIA